MICFNVDDRLSIEWHIHRRNTFDDRKILDKIYNEYKKCHPQFQDLPTTKMIKDLNLGGKYCPEMITGEF